MVGNTGEALAEHWDGVQWSNIPVPVPPTSLLHGVAVVAAADVWAVGGSGWYLGSQILIMHWDGVNWSVVPGPGGNQAGVLHEVTAVSVGDVWAAGYLVDSN